MKQKNKIGISQPDFKTYYVVIELRLCGICEKIKYR